MTRCVDALTLSHAGTTKIMISPAIKTNTTTEEGRAVHTCHKLGTRSCRPPDTRLARLARQYEVVKYGVKVAMGLMGLETVIDTSFSILPS